MKLNKRKGMLAAIACLGGALIVGAGYATWVYNTTASNASQPAVSVGAVIYLSGVTVYKHGTTTAPNITLNLTSPSDLAWSDASDWDVGLTGDFTGMTSGQVSVTIANAASTYVTFGTFVSSITGYTKSSPTKAWSLPTLTYATGVASQNYASYAAMRTALAAKTITITFSATVS
jgi:hypothetical protein